MQCFIQKEFFPLYQLHRGLGCSPDSFCNYKPPESDFGVFWTPKQCHTCNFLALYELWSDWIDIPTFCTIFAFVIDS